jgi:hypothetical protein
MTESDLELTDEVRKFLDNDEITISDEQLRVALRRAKNHIVSRKRSLNRPSNVNWYAAGEPFEEALFWWTCTFAKIITGELDAPSGSIGDIETQTLKTKNTEVYNRAVEALDRIDADGRFGSRVIPRSGRDRYGEGEDTSL